MYCESDFQRRLEHPDAESSPHDEYSRDYARLVHSAAVRRLARLGCDGLADESGEAPTVLSRALEAAEIARRIVKRLNQDVPFLRRGGGGIDPNLVALGCIGRECGRPPFGKLGESILDRCMRQHGGFMSSAQCLRQLAVIEIYASDDPQLQCIDAQGKDRRLGLDLSYRSYAALTRFSGKIPFRRDDRSERSGSHYASEDRLVGKIRAHVAPGVPDHETLQTIECGIAELAEFIATTVLEFESAMRTGLAHPLCFVATFDGDDGLCEMLVEDLYRRTGRRTNGHQVRAAIGREFEQLIDPAANASVSSNVRAYRVSRELSGNPCRRAQYIDGLTKRLIDAVLMRVEDEAPALSSVRLSDDAQLLAEAMRAYCKEVAPAPRRMALQGIDAGKVLETLLDAIDGDYGDELLPPGLACGLARIADTDARKRYICDFLAGLTEPGAVALLNRLSILR
ncbi:MAG: hypothetical protein KF778_03620 [Rhodocyclaceae bacterium]|nr:hypothetical protein [Rhodocyclaceae bacterium]MBX3667467.1 hypothetical protein [Rhodocyclaceae bacterium]